MNELMIEAIQLSKVAYFCKTLVLFFTTSAVAIIAITKLVIKKK